MSTGGQPAPDGGGQVATAPWAGVGEGQQWQIDGKPWYDVAIPEGPEREVVKTKNYAHPGVLAKSYAELERKASSWDESKVIRVPDANAKPEDWRAVYEKLGAPKDVNGYDAVKWGETADPAMVTFAKEMAFELGLPLKAVEGVMLSKWNTFAEKQNQAAIAKADADATTALASLQSEWKGDFEKNKAKGQLVLRALDKAGFSDADLAAVEKSIGVAPVVKLLATIGKLSGEGGMPDLSGGGSGGSDIGSMSPEQANNEIMRLQTDTAFQKTYLGKTEQGHEDAVKRMEALYAKANSVRTP